MISRAAIEITQPTWEAERHRRGLIRWYPFDSTLQAGFVTAGASATLDHPGLRLISGVSAGGGDYRGTERGERRLTYWRTHPDLKLYWQADHRLTCFMSLENFVCGPNPDKVYAGVFLKGFGGPQGGWDPPAPPVCALLASKDEADVRQWELLHCVGGGATNITRTVLTGVNPPTDSASAGPQPRMRRLELYYRPGEYISASIDGVEGARATTNLPNVNATHLAAEMGAGIGVYSGGELGSIAIATFFSLMIESLGYIP